MSTETNQTARKSRTGHIEIPIKKTVQSQDCTVFHIQVFSLAVNRSALCQPDAHFTYAAVCPEVVRD